MARQRLGVVLLLPQPLASEVTGLRRALGDGAMARIEPHITLVPPINVHDRDLASVLRHVRDTASAAAPLSLRLGPVTTFLPVNPVAYLPVGGAPDQFEALLSLRAAVRSGPLGKEDTHEYVPHVTVADDLPADRIEAAVAAMASFEADLSVDRIHVMTQRADKVWVPIADAVLGAKPGVVGRGTIPLTVSESGRPDLAAAALLAIESEPNGQPFALSARTEDELVAACWGWTSGEWLEIADFVVAAAHRGLGIGRHLLAAVESLGARRGCRVAGVTAAPSGAAGALLSAAGWTIAGPTDHAQVHWHRTISASDTD